MSVKELNTELVLWHLTKFCKKDRGIISLDLLQQGSDRPSSNIRKKSPPKNIGLEVLWGLFLACLFFFFLFLFPVYFPPQNLPLCQWIEHISFERFILILSVFLRLLLSRKKTPKMVIFQTKPELFSLHCEWSPWPTELSSYLCKSSTFLMLKIEFSFCCLQNLPQGKSLSFLVFWHLSYFKILVGTEMWDLPRNWKQEPETLIKRISQWISRKNLGFFGRQSSILLTKNQGVRYLILFWRNEI